MKNSLWQNVSYFCSTAGAVSISVHSKLKVIVQVDVPVWSVCHYIARALQKPADRKLLSHSFFIVTVVLTSHWQTQSLTSRLIHLSVLLISAYNRSSAALSLSQHIAPLWVSFLTNTPEFLHWLLSTVMSATLIRVLSWGPLCSWAPWIKVCAKSLLLRSSGNKLFKRLLNLF